jgi:hypothetical protein
MPQISFNEKLVPYKNIKETQKLFSIEGVDRGQVRVRTSDYLLSLPDDKQISTWKI